MLLTVCAMTDARERQRWLIEPAVGVAAFLAAHFLEVAAWSAFGAPAHEPWFLNSGRAVLVTVVLLFLTSAAIGWRTRQPWPGPASRVTAGAGVAALGVAFVTGPGTLFPIVVVAALAVIAIAVFAGTCVGFTFAGTTNHPANHRPR